MKELQTTLLYLLKDNQILLAMKKRGFGVGKYNGIGGKLESGETVEQALVRETQEEICVTPTKYQDHGVLQFDMYFNGEHFLEDVHVFTATEFEGEPHETEEMCPTWFAMQDLPYQQMFQTDRIWLPLVLEKRATLIGVFKFSDDIDSKLVDYHLDWKPLAD